MKMKKIVSVILLVSIMAGIYACKKDEDKAKPAQPPQVEDFILKGTVQTDQTISPENIAEVYIECDDDDSFLAATGKINSDNTFAIPIKNPEDSLRFVTIAEMQNDLQGHIIKLECKKDKIKTGVFTVLPIKNSGTEIFGFESIVLSTGEVAIYGDENTYIPHTILYYYSSEDLVLHTDRIPGETDDLKVTCDLKKGWNLVKGDMYHEGRNHFYIELTSISEVPEGYAWYLASDIITRQKISNISNILPTSIF